MFSTMEEVREMKTFFKCIIVSLVSIVFLSTPSQKVEAHELKSEPTAIFQETNDLDWNDVDEVIVLYDDGTIKPSSPAEEEKMAKALNVGLFMMPRSSIGTYFSKVLWINRDGLSSLSIYPKYLVPLEDSWSVLATTYQNHPLWRGEPNPTKYSSMYNQYKCHYWVAGMIKVPWNIEPSRADRGYLQFVNYFCN